MSTTIFDEIKKAQDAWDSPIEKDGLILHVKDILKKVEFYSNSQFITGSRDELGRDKPFDNIVNPAVNVAVRATDFDTKDIQLIPKAPNLAVKAMMLRKELKNWMEEANYSKYLNDEGEAECRYGGAITKITETKDELFFDVVDWFNIKVNQVNFADGAKIEIHYMTQLELNRKRKSWDGLDKNWDDIMELFEVEAKKKKGGKILNTIEVYEVEGEFPRECFLEDYEGDDDSYSLQKYFLIMSGKERQYVLYKEEIKKTAYEYNPFNPRNAIILGRGIVEDGFEPQKWVNDSRIKEKDVMEMASKLIFKSDDPQIGENALTSYLTGDIIPLSEGKDITPLNTVSNAIPQFNNNVESWKGTYQSITSTFSAITGEEMPANTPLGALQIQNQEARSIFDYRREQRGIFHKRLVLERVIPFLVKRMSKSHVLNAQFSGEELKMIDNDIAIYEVNNMLIDEILDGKVVTSEDYDFKKDEVVQKYQKGRDRRFIDIPDNYYDDLKDSVMVVTTNEQFNKTAMLQSLSSVIQTVSQNPQILEHPMLSQVFGQMIEMSGIGISPTLLNAPTLDTKKVNGNQMQGMVDQPKDKQEAPAPVN